jgi:hypothetical protein
MRSRVSASSVLSSTVFHSPDSVAFVALKIVTELFLPGLPKVNESQSHKADEGEQATEEKAVLRDDDQGVSHSGVP